MLLSRGIRAGLSVFVVTGFALLCSHAVAATGASSGTKCDPNIMNAMKDKATLSATAEVAANNKIIKRPDSVFQYSCFDQQADQVKDAILPIFSTNTSSSSSGIGGSLGAAVGGALGGSLGGSLGAAAGGALGALLGSGITGLFEGLFDAGIDAYTSLNFPDTLLGGSLEGISADDIVGMLGPVQPGEFNCNVGSAVWEQATSQPFASDEGEGFFSIDDMLNSPTTWKLASSAVDMLQGRKAGAMGLLADGTRAFGAGEAQRMTNYMKRVNSDRSSCGSPIYTGMMVNTGSSMYRAGYCSKPGCSYTPREGNTSSGLAGGTCTCLNPTTCS